MHQAQEDWAATQTGRVIAERWRLGRVLGIGGSAVVFEATHRNGSRVAIKLLAPERARDERRRARFLRESHAANRVRHTRVVKVYDDGEEPDGTVYLVMELLSGDSLDRMARRAGGKLPWLMVAEIVIQLLEVLEHAHERGIVHRDIKPANLIWTPGTGLRLLDFGLARLTETKSGEQTRDGVVVGTPSFMPPEQARAASHAVNPLSDLWAVGATAFTLLTGRLVYEADTVEEQLALAAASSAPSLDKLATDVPAPIRAVLQRALEYDPADRWPSARAMLTALQEALGDRDVRTPRSPTTEETTAVEALEQVPPSAKDRRRARGLGLLVVGLVGGIVAWGATRGKASHETSDDAARASSAPLDTSRSTATGAAPRTSGPATQLASESSSPTEPSLVNGADRPSTRSAAASAVLDAGVAPQRAATDRAAGERATAPLAPARGDRAARVPRPRPAERKNPAPAREPAPGDSPTQLIEEPPF